jgi:hypothetical protein
MCRLSTRNSSAKDHHHTNVGFTYGTTHLICVFPKHRLGNLLLAVQEFKISESDRAAGVTQLTAGLNFVGVLSTAYAKTGYVDGGRLLAPR